MSTVNLKKAQIDAFSLTFQITSRADQYVVSKRLGKLFKKHRCKKLGGKNWNGFLYKKAFKFSLTSKHGPFECVVGVSPRPKYRGAAYMWIYFNPRRAGKLGNLQVKRLVHQLLGMKLLYRIYSSIKITRLDYHINQEMYAFRYLPHIDGATYSEIRAGDNEIESAISGSPSSEIRLTVYDKGEESQEEMWEGVIRAEFRIRPKQTTLAEFNLMYLAKCFAKAKFYNMSFLNDNAIDREVREVAREKGISAALAALPDRYSKDKARRRLRNHHMEDPFGFYDLEEHGLRIMRFFESWSWEMLSSAEVMEKPKIIPQDVRNNTDRRGRRW